jgi:aminoglycoside phosphotransferase (APT) family kinase protein
MADRVVPGAVPRVLAHDVASGLFAMEYLDPGDHPVGKGELRAGRADPAFAMEVGRRIGAIHAATAHDRAVAERFDTIAIFRPIRLEAYLEAAAERHPAVARQLFALSQETARQRIALVHGDVSPKNILVGPGGPVFLDAECAWYGDPAFDLAFCLTHLLLKCLWVPQARDGFLACFDAMTTAYLAVCAWEAPAGLEWTGDAGCNALWTALHGPCASLPAGVGPQGLPLGVQLVGRFGADAAFLAAAGWVEAVLPVEER